MVHRHCQGGLQVGRVADRGVGVAVHLAGQIAGPVAIEIRQPVSHFLSRTGHVPDIHTVAVLPVAEVVEVNLIQALEPVGGVRLVAGNADGQLVDTTEDPAEFIVRRGHAPHGILRFPGQHGQEITVAQFDRITYRPGKKIIHPGRGGIQVVVMRQGPQLVGSGVVRI